jgi:hypothetical protein
MGAGRPMTVKRLDQTVLCWSAAVFNNMPDTAARGGRVGELLILKLAAVGNRDCAGIVAFLGGGFTRKTSQLDLA